MGGQGVHLASVVAILPNGSAVSNLTNPDGTYEIDGLPPGNYWVYVHPLPCGSVSNGVCADANVTLPLQPDGQTPVAPDGPFVSTFYPGAWDPIRFHVHSDSAGRQRRWHRLFGAAAAGGGSIRCDFVLVSSLSVSRRRTGLSAACLSEYE